MGTFDKVVAVDGGLRHCAHLGLTPDLICGDFDSTPEELLRHYDSVKRLTAPRDKDESDLELALHAIEPASFEEVVLLAALGGRIDHLLANLYLLTRYPGTVKAVNANEAIWAVGKGCTLNLAVGQELSLMPLGEVCGVTTRGLKWELNQKTLSPNFFSLSNIALQPRVEIEVRSGHLLVSIQ